MEEKISFCTTCMGRRHQLEKVYRGNLEAARSYPNVEFVLLDYHSPDGLENWVNEELREWMAAGRVRYFRTTQPRRFHHAHAKNTAHRLATGEILVNLDADNSFEPGFCEEIAGLFAGGARVVAAFPGLPRGCVGRVALQRRDFLALGGYNESFKGWGAEDLDLVARAEAAGLERRELDLRHAKALQHSDQERRRFTAEKRIYHHNRRHHAQSRNDVAMGRWVANLGHEWGRAQLCGTGEEPGTGEYQAPRAEWDTSKAGWDAEMAVSAEME